MFCKHCGAPIAEQTVICTKCGCSVAGTHTHLDANAGHSATTRMLLPVGRSGWAIAAGYAGLLSLIPFFGIFAVIFGILALNDIKAHPEKHGAGRAWFGIIFGGLTLLVCLFGFFCAASN